MSSVPETGATDISTEPPVVDDNKAVEPTLPNGNDLEVNEIDNRTNGIKEEKEKENVGGCCQGANGFSCCRDDEKTEIVTETEKEVKKPAGKLDFLTKKWEQHEVFTTAALVVAIVTVAVAYSFYKRSR
ncbi:hypothetical protein Ccrd_019247 [Cynara cardunculus var. scolymus]|uniref:Transmembrane protein n=1 Tax=Cynara cardunculus var. scolymus TaxID=59895 RepID=A0A124SF86_CYNCS|nr:hypothetical protein Ccrd_019247 [Cynara cardunculus var. scolymus]